MRDLQLTNGNLTISRLDLQLVDGGEAVAQRLTQKLKLFRGDFQTRMTGYATAIQNSIQTPNEVRQKENLPVAAGGDSLMIQQNMSDLNQLGAQQPEPEPDNTGEDDEQ